MSVARIDARSPCSCQCSPLLHNEASVPGCINEQNFERRSPRSLDDICPLVHSSVLNYVPCSCLFFIVKPGVRRATTRKRMQKGSPIPLALPSRRPILRRREGPADSVKHGVPRLHVHFSPPSKRIFAFILIENLNFQLHFRSIRNWTPRPGFSVTQLAKLSSLQQKKR